MTVPCRDCNIEPNVSLTPNGDGTMAFALTCPKCSRCAEITVKGNERASDGAERLNGIWKAMNG